MSRDRQCFFIENALWQEARRQSKKYAKSKREKRAGTASGYCRMATIKQLIEDKPEIAKDLNIEELTRKE